MRVKLKVVSGAHAGKEIPITVPRFLVGRGEGCQLRPQSDMVSRQHAELVIKDRKLVVSDLGSRNGTIVNGEKISGPRALAIGDLVRIGPLEFEVEIDHSPGGVKQPKVNSVQEAVARTTQAASSDSAWDDDDVSSWLTEEDEADRQRRSADPETRQFKLDETDQVKLKKAADAAKKGEADKKKKKREPMKLPQSPNSLQKSSHDAAEHALRKLVGGPGPGHQK